MNWYSGNIAEAVAHSKIKDAVFVVYIEGNDDMSERLKKFIDDERIRSKLESDNFVAIKIEGDSEAYTQFRSIYRVVPVPSIFFIGKSGTPLDVGTGIIANVEELLNKIDSVLVSSGKKSASATASATTSLLAAEQANSAINQVESNASSITKDSSNEKSEVMTENGQSTGLTCSSDALSVPETFSYDNSSISVRNVAGDDTTKDDNEKNKAEEAPPAAEQSTSNVSRIVPSVPRILDAISQVKTLFTSQGDTVVATSPASTEPPATEAPSGSAAVPSTSAAIPSPSVSEASSQERIAQLQRTLEEKRRERIEEETRMEREIELRRRKESRDTQNTQSWQREQELRNLQESIRRERQADQEARDRIRAQIAADRAERAAQSKRELEDSSGVAPVQAAPPMVAPQVSFTAPNETRLQFRLPGGVHKTKTFNSHEPLTVVRDYVRAELLEGTGIRDFKLATNYPRREFKLEDEIKTLTDLNLVPNAVVLVLTNDKGLMRSNRGFMNILITVFWAMITPAAMAFDYVHKMGFQRVGQRISDGLTNLGWKRPPNGDFVIVQGDPSRRRNMDIFVAPSMPLRPENLPNPNPEQGVAQEPTQGPTQGPKQGNPESAAGFQPRRPYVGGESNIHRLRDPSKEPKDDNATYNGNSTQQQ